MTDTQLNTNRKLRAEIESLRQQLEAAEWFDDGCEYSAANNTARKLRHMAKEMK